MDLLKLNGPLHERIAAAVEFAKAHNSHRIYGAAHVPFTEAARRFHEEYGGVFTDCVLCDLDESNPIDFTCHLIGCPDIPAEEEARRLHRWHLLGGQLIRQGRDHIAGESEESDDESDTPGGQIVPVG